MLQRGLLVILTSALTLLSLTLSADEQPPPGERPYDEEFFPKPEPVPPPWFTGPIIAPSGHVIPLGHINIEPYFFANVNRGAYNSHWAPKSEPNFYNLSTQVPIQVGIFNRWDFSFTPEFAWNHTEGASQWVLNDIPWQFDYQVVYDNDITWYPAIKLSFKANLPIGRYQKLDPNKKDTDDGGSGSWEPGLGLTLSRLFYLSGRHYLAARWAVAYTVPNSVHVKGFNAYGGGHHTYGTVYPGATLFADIGLEYSLTQNWALALDVLYIHSNHTRFSGRKGKTDGVTNSIGGPSSESFSLAPAFEYNWSSTCGLIAGIWFSVAGRNASEFVNGVVAINIYK
jgi:hypothetical protein